MAAGSQLGREKGGALTESWFIFGHAVVVLLVSRTAAGEGLEPAVHFLETHERLPPAKLS